MKRLSSIVFVVSGLVFGLAALFTGAAQELRAQSTAARSVYLLPMSGGLDQYLAEWITRDHVLQVTADASAADLVLTDRLGSTLEKKLIELHPKEDEEDADSIAPRYRGGSSRGSVFLVDAKSRNVVWSDFQKPSNGSPVRMNREAHRLAKNLQSAMSKGFAAK